MTKAPLMALAASRVPLVETHQPSLVAWLSPAPVVMTLRTQLTVRVGTFWPERVLMESLVTIFPLQAQSEVWVDMAVMAVMAIMAAMAAMAVEQLSLRASIRRLVLVAKTTPTQRV